MAVSQARQTESRIHEHFPHVQNPVLGGFHPLRMAQAHRYKRFWPPRFPFSRILGDFGLVHRKWVKNDSKNDTGPFGVFLARSEASLSRFDLRRVVWFTYPQCAFQTMHALPPTPTPTPTPSNNACPSKGGQWSIVKGNGVKWGFTKKRETHPLQLGPSTQS